MSSDQNAIDRLNEASSLIVLILSIISIVSGGIGLIFNILIFTRPSLRRQPCVIYFFWSTCFSVIVIFIIQPVRVVAASFNIDQANYNLGICKIEWFVLFATRTVASWLVVLACTDRFLHSSANEYIRRLSSLKTAKIATGVTSIMIYLLYSHMIFYYEITYASDRFGNITPSCSSQTGIYRTFFGFWNMLWYSLCPCILMFLFGLLTLNNLRQHRAVFPLNTETNRLVRRTDTQLLRMLTAQVLVTIICTLPLSINHLYQSFTSNNSVKDTFLLAQQNLLGRTVGIIPYFAHSSTFYLYTLTGTIFRKELLRIIRRCWYFNRNQVAPPRKP